MRIYREMAYNRKKTTYLTFNVDGHLRNRCSRPSKNNACLEGEEADRKFINGEIKTN